MKITSNNPRILDPNEAYNKDNKGAAKQAEETPKNDLKDRVELSGAATVRNQSGNRIGNAYINNGAAPTDQSQSQPVLNVSPETSVSAQRLEEIRDRVKDGYYDSDDVMNSVAQMMVNDVKKIDHNM